MMDGTKELGDMLLKMWERPTKEASENSSLKNSLDILGLEFGNVLVGSIYDKVTGR